MKPLGDKLRHFWLAQRMAKEGGVDLAQAQEEGLLNQENWAEMVQRCRGCAWVDGCERWLKALEQGRDLPGDCVNHKEFAALRDRLSEGA